MNKIRKQYRDLIVCMIPRKYEAKDISDFYQKYGRSKTIEVIKEYINFNIDFVDSTNKKIYSESSLFGREINIDTKPVVFSFVGNIQEETHRFAINYHRKLRSKRMKYSELDAIDGIGPKRKQDLLRQFKSISAISDATLSELERILPQNAAFSVYQHFHTNDKK